MGTSINGAWLWIRLGPLSFQPSELAKIALTIFFAGNLVRKREALATVRRRILGWHSRGRAISARCWWPGWSFWACSRSSATWARR